MYFSSNRTFSLWFLTGPGQSGSDGGPAAGGAETGSGARTEGAEDTAGDIWFLVSVSHEVKHLSSVFPGSGEGFKNLVSGSVLKEDPAGPAGREPSSEAWAG